MLVPEGLLMELGPAPGANWNFVLGQLQLSSASMSQ